MDGGVAHPRARIRKSHARYAPHAVSKQNAIYGYNVQPPECRGEERRRVYAVAGRRPSLPSLGGGGGISSFVFSAIILWKPMPTPSMTASRTAQPMAPLRMALGPPRTASAPPVKKPAMMAFQGSSFLRMPFTAQSNVLNMPPQTPKLPPRTGARALIAVMAVDGNVRNPLFSASAQCAMNGILTSYPPLAVRAVSVSLHTMPYCSPDCLSQIVRTCPLLSCASVRIANVLPCRMLHRNQIARPMGKDLSSGPDRVPRPLCRCMWWWRWWKW